MFVCVCVCVCLSHIFSEIPEPISIKFCMTPRFWSDILNLRDWIILSEDFSTPPIQINAL